MRRISAIIAVALALAACSGTRKEAPELLRTVPSRSVEVMYFRHAGKALELLLDSTHVFRAIDLGRLGGTEMVLSYDFTPGRVPLLSLDAGRYRTDSSETVKSILAQAPELGLQAAYVVDSVRRSTALLLTPSTAALSEALIHIAAGTSILDAKDFPEAYAISKGSEGCVILRNAAGGMLLPKTFLNNGEVHRGMLSRFIVESAKWTVVSFNSYKPESLDMQFCPIGPEHYVMSMFAGIKGGESRLGKIVPADADWVVDLPIADYEAWYESRCKWMDATSRYKSHKWACEDTVKRGRIDPRDWYRSLRPKEVALMRWEGHCVTAIRCSKAPARMELEPNPHPGYARLMFGRYFAEPEGSVCSTLGRWIILGPAEDVSAFIEAEKAEGRSIKHLKYQIRRPDLLLTGTDSGTSISYSK